MIIKREIIKNNLSNIRKVIEENKFLLDYYNDVYNKSSYSNIGIYYTLNLINYEKTLNKYKIVDLDKNIKYTTLCKILKESCDYDFSKKTRSGFIKIFKSHKLFAKYNKRRELFANEFIIFCFLSQNNADVDFNIINQFPNSKLILEELDINKNLNSLMISHTLSIDFNEFVQNKQSIDIKKININYISNIVKDMMRKLLTLEKGSIVICNTEIHGFTVDRKYEVSSHNINYDGYLEILTVDDFNNHVWVKYCNFTEITKSRQEKLDILGLF